MAAHRIFSAIAADSYVSDKSFGGEFEARLGVGIDGKPSNLFTTITVREHDRLGDWTMFVLYIDGREFKRAYFNNRTREFVPVVDEDAEHLPELERARASWDSLEEWKRAALPVAIEQNERQSAAARPAINGFNHSVPSRALRFA